MNTDVLPEQLCLMHKGYQGIAKLHSSSYTPTQKPRQAQLDQFERQHNRLSAQLQVVAENINRRLKIFRIFAKRYCNRRRNCSDS